MIFTFIILMTAVFAQPNDVCVIGSPLVNQYVQHFNKQDLTEEDSFLKKYREYQVQKFLSQTTQAAVSKNPFRGIISQIGSSQKKQDYLVDKNLVSCSLRRVPMISTSKKICESASSDILEPKNPDFYTEETPCVTQPMVDYLHWGLNEALKCFDSDLDDIGRKIIFKKINLESSFGFFFQSINGTGVAQVIPKDIQDMLKEGYSGHRFLKRHISRHPQKCASFVELFNKDFLVNSNNQIPQCQFINVGDGIGRSYIAGVGLYVYYRSYHPNSAEKMLEYLGIPKSQSRSYRQMRASLALGMYNKGPKTVWDAVQLHFQPKELARKYKRSPQLAFAKVREKIEMTSFSVYISELENIYKRTVDSKGNCKLPDPQQNVVQKESDNFSM